MTLQDNLDIYDKMIQKNRLQAYLKAKKTITRKKELFERFKFMRDLENNPSKFFNFYKIKFMPVEKKKEKKEEIPWETLENI